MSAKPENIKVNFLENNLNLGSNVIGVEEYNNGRVSPVSDPRSPSPIQSFFKKATNTLKSFKKPFKRPSSPILSFEEIQTTPLYTYYDEYLMNPSANALKTIKSEVTRLGINSPIVRTLRSYAESLFENAAYTGEAKAEQAVVNVLGGSTHSSGGKRSTRKQKRASLKRKRSTRK